MIVMQTGRTARAAIDAFNGLRKAKKDTACCPC
jgi:pyrimidine operon attenuation protein/uracil phosphoribosyltransferase